MSDADYESHFLFRMWKMRQVRRAIREKISSEFGIQEK